MHGTGRFDELGRSPRYNRRTYQCTLKPERHVFFIYTLAGLTKSHSLQPLLLLTKLLFHPDITYLIVPSITVARSSQQILLSFHLLLVLSPPPSASPLFPYPLLHSLCPSIFLLQYLTFFLKTHISAPQPSKAHRSKQTVPHIPHLASRILKPIPTITRISSYRRMKISRPTSLSLRWEAHKLRREAYIMH